MKELTKKQKREAARIFCGNLLKQVNTEGFAETGITENDIDGITAIVHGIGANLLRNEGEELLNDIHSIIKHVTAKPIKQP